MPARVWCRWLRFAAMSWESDGDYIITWRVGAGESWLGLARCGRVLGPRNHPTESTTLRLRSAASTRVDVGCLT
jgi:hypothetical protein